MQDIDLQSHFTRAAVSRVDDAARTVDLVFSTGAGVARVDTTGRRFLEVLSLDPKHVRLDRLNAGAPLLNSHAQMSLQDVIGSVMVGSARVEARAARATVRFSRRPDVEPIWQDVRDKIIRNVSVGYRVHRFRETSKEDSGLPTWTAIDWEPFELSLVAIGADPGAQVRAGAVQTNRCVVLMPGAAAVDRARWLHDARQRVNEDADRERLRRLRIAQARVWGLGA